MKYLVVLLVVLLFAWLMLRGRAKPEVSQRRKTPDAAQAMVVCEHCGVHLPRAEAVVDRSGDFCSEAHRLAGPKRS